MTGKGESGIRKKKKHGERLPFPLISFRQQVSYQLIIAYYDDIIIKFLRIVLFYD